MSRKAISLFALKEVVADLGQVFTTKEVSEDIRMKQAHLNLVDHRNYHAFVGGALSDHRAQLEIDEIKKNTPRGSRWKKLGKLSGRLQKDRPMTMVSIRIPTDVIEDLKRIAPLLGFSGYQALIKAYIGQGLRTDMERLEGGLDLPALVKILREKGVEDEIISSAISEARDAGYDAGEKE